MLPCSSSESERPARGPESPTRRSEGLGGQAAGSEGSQRVQPGSLGGQLEVPRGQQQVC